MLDVEQLAELFRVLLRIDQDIARLDALVSTLAAAIAGNNRPVLRRSHHAAPITIPCEEPTTSTDEEPSSSNEDDEWPPINFDKV